MDLGSSLLPGLLLSDSSSGLAQSSNQQGGNLTMQSFS